SIPGGSGRAIPGAHGPGRGMCTPHRDSSPQAPGYRAETYAARRCVCRIAALATAAMRQRTLRAMRFAESLIRVQRRSTCSYRAVRAVAQGKRGSSAAECVGAAVGTEQAMGGRVALRVDAVQCLRYAMGLRWALRAIRLRRRFETRWARASSRTVRAREGARGGSRDGFTAFLEEALAHRGSLRRPLGCRPRTLR